MSKPKIGILISSTRDGRFADKPAAWFYDLASKRVDMTFETLDLRDYPLPFFNEERSPAVAPPKDTRAVRWGSKVVELDGFVVIAAEYNHGPTAVLKNALDYAYEGFKMKPIAFIGYGGVGAARAIEQLRMISIELQLVPTKTGVHISMAEFIGLGQGKTFGDFPYLANSAGTLLDEISMWAKLLKKARLKA